MNRAKYAEMIQITKNSEVAIHEPIIALAKALTEDNKEASIAIVSPTRKAESEKCVRITHKDKQLIKKAIRKLEVNPFITYLRAGFKDEIMIKKPEMHIFVEFGTEVKHIERVATTYMSNEELSKRLEKNTRTKEQEKEDMEKIRQGIVIAEELTGCQDITGLNYRNGIIEIESCFNQKEAKNAAKFYNALAQNIHRYQHKDHAIGYKAQVYNKAKRSTRKVYVSLKSTGEVRYATN